MYHYTNLETLALILKNRTIRFNNLADMDDLEEGDTRDLGKVGKYVFISSWTKDELESIPLWNLYTPNATGVRIKLKENFFEKETIPKEIFQKKVEYLDDPIIYELAREEEFAKGLFEVQEMANCTFYENIPWLSKVEYTSDSRLLKPAFRDADSSIYSLGKYKRSEWAFQNEYRYIIHMHPFTYEESHIQCLVDQSKYQETLRDYYETYTGEAPIKYFDLKIDMKEFENMEILCGPKMNEGHKIIVDALVRDYNPNATVKYSELKLK